LQDRPDKNLLDFLTTIDTESYLRITLNPGRDPAPPLYIHPAPDAVVLEWPAAKTNFALQSNPEILDSTWTPVATPPVVAGEFLVVTSPISRPKQFYRLQE
jgi:hypothetical protein